MSIDQCSRVKLLIRRTSSNIAGHDENELQIEGYRLSLCRTLLICGLCFMSGGLLFLLYYWRRDWALRCTHSACPVYQADRLLIKDKFSKSYILSLKVLTFDENGTLMSHNYRSRSNSSRNCNFSLFCNEKLGQSHWITNQVQTNGQVEYFQWQKICYFWNNDDHKFKQISGLDEDVTINFLLNCQPLSSGEVHFRAALFGTNNVVINIPSILSILIKEVLSPFYIFQLFSVILWCYQEYIIYSTAISVMAIFSMIMTTYETRTARIKLHKLIKEETKEGVKLLRKNGYVIESCENVVPGDIIEISPEGQSMLCDAVLIDGVCVVDESMLTGESLPVTKTALCQGFSSEFFNDKIHSRSVLLRGTQVLQARPLASTKKRSIHAVVIRTGWITAKGRLLQAILYPKPYDRLFENDVLKFVGLISILAAMGMVYSVFVQINAGSSVSEIVISVLNIITIAVPPSIPAIMACGIFFALRRLKKLNIFCISPSSINMSGDIDAVVLDKTGTLTHDGLNIQCILPSKEGEFGKVVDAFEPKLLSHPLIHNMAACHSLNIIRGNVVGDYVDTAMFNFTTWTLTAKRTQDVILVRSNRASENLQNDVEISLLRVFPFESALQRQACIVQYRDAANYTLFVKGSPEMIASLCCTESLPENFKVAFCGFAKEGNRIFAAAFKTLFIEEDEVFKISREEIERDLTFCGLIVSENKIKEQTRGVITQLRHANIRPIMATGDNLLTALSVARSANFFDDNAPVYLVEWSNEEDRWTYRLLNDTKDEGKELLFKNYYGSETRFSQRHYLAMTGATWEIMRQKGSHLIEQFVLMGVVFARMASHQKAQLVDALQKLECSVAMCGDGTNDCEALRAANTGLSLSKAEASVACAFTSQKGNIGAVLDVIREGRCAFITSYGNMQYVASCTMISFIISLILYSIGSNMSDGEYLYMDLIVQLPLSLMFGLTASNPVLDREKLRIRLLNGVGVAVFVLHLSITFVVQLLAFYLIRAQPWFIPFVKKKDFHLSCFEQTAIFKVSVFLYIIQAIIHSKGHPFRKAFYTNYAFSAYLMMMTCLAVGIVIHDEDWISGFLLTEHIPSLKFKLILLGIALAHAFLSLTVDFLIKQTKLCEKLQKSEVRDYEKIVKKFDLTPWPPI